MANLIEDDVIRMINKVNNDNLPFDEKTDLFGNGILDSLGIANMIMMIEEEFKIEISPEDIIPDNFIDIVAITGMIDRYI